MPNTPADVTLYEFLWGWLWIVGSTAILLIAPAVRHARDEQQTGRLASTFIVLAALVLAGWHGMVQNAPLDDVWRIVVVMLDLGMLGYVLYLPQQGILALLKRALRRERGVDR